MKPILHGARLYHEVDVGFVSSPCELCPTADIGVRATLKKPRRIGEGGLEWGSEAARNDLALRRAASWSRRLETPPAYRVAASGGVAPTMVQAAVKERRRRG